MGANLDTPGLKAQGVEGLRVKKEMVKASLPPTRWHCFYLAALRFGFIAANKSFKLSV